MNILIAPDSFKGTLSSRQIIEIISKQAIKYFPGCTVTGVPVADGGEGTIQAVLSSRPGFLRTLEVKGPLFEPVKASYALLGPGLPDKAAPAHSALIEMSAASGITLIPAAPGNALRTSSYGTGQLLADAVLFGCREITVALGGSATNDGGCGAMAALGYRFLDQNGREILPTGENLVQIRHIDTSQILPQLKDLSLTVMCDVRNPLLGPDGATYTYGPQKGASASQLALLEEGMTCFADVVRRELGTDFSGLPGAGAAGGLGGALVAFLGGKLQSGILTMLEIVRFRELAKQADLIITGEGLADAQSLRGKVLWGIGQYAKAADVPVIAIVGGMKPEAKGLYECGITAFVPALNQAATLDEVLKGAPRLLSEAAERAFLLLKTGSRLTYE